MFSLRAAVYSFTGNETSPKVRCPFQTVVAMVDNLRAQVGLAHNANIFKMFCSLLSCSLTFPMPVRPLTGGEGDEAIPGCFMLGGAVSGGGKPLSRGFPLQFHPKPRRASFGGQFQRLG